MIFITLIIDINKIYIIFNKTVINDSITKYQ